VCVYKIYIYIYNILVYTQVLAGVGLFAFIMAMHALQETGSTQNPYMPLFAIYTAIWSINFSTGWKRLEITYQVKILEKTDL